MESRSRLINFAVAGDGGLRSEAVGEVKESISKWRVRVLGAVRAHCVADRGHSPQLRRKLRVAILSASEEPRSCG